MLQCFALFLLVCFTSLYEIWKEIVLLVTAACRPRWECSTNPMRGREENLKYSVPLDLSQILLGLFREWTCVYMVQGQQMYKDGWFSKHSQRQSQKQVTPAVAQWLSNHRWASGMQETTHHISCSSTCTFYFLHSADLWEEAHSTQHLSTQTWHKERYFSIV